MEKEKGSKSRDFKTLFLKKDRKSVHGRRRKWKSLETHISCGKDTLHLSKPALLVESSPFKKISRNRQEGVDQKQAVADLFGKMAREIRLRLRECAPLISWGSLLSFSLFLCVSVSVYLARARALSLLLSRSLVRAHALSLSILHPPILSLSLSLSLSFSLSRVRAGARAPSLSFSLSLSHTRTISLSLARVRALSLSLSLRLSSLLSFSNTHALTPLSLFPLLSPHPSRLHSPPTLEPTLSTFLPDSPTNPPPFPPTLEPTLPACALQDNGGTHK